MSQSSNAGNSESDDHGDTIRISKEQLANLIRSLPPVPSEIVLRARCRDGRNGKPRNFVSIRFPSLLSSLLAVKGSARALFRSRTY